MFGSGAVMGLFDRFFGPPGKDAFARLMMEALRQAGAPQPIQYDKAHFKLTLPGGNLVFLDNAYAEYCAASKDLRPAILERYARLPAPSDVPDDFDEALPRVLPRVRERFFYTATRLQLDLQGQPLMEFAFRPFADHYAIELGYDSPQSVMMIGASQLETWDVRFEEALEKSWPNLRAITDRPLETVQPGLYVSAWKDSYDASRALLHDFILSHKVQGEPVVAIPNRDTLLLTGTNDAAGLARLAERVEKSMAEPRAMAGIPLVLSERSYAAWVPPPDHPAHGPLKLLTLKSLGGFYGEQKELLDATYEKKGEDVFVASLTVTRHETTGAYSSYCVWSEGVTALLPEAERIFFLRAGRDGMPDKKAAPVIAEWSRVRDVAGELMKPLDGYPLRYRVDRFPSAAQLASLK